MKVRSGFVTNSSSTSFIMIGNEIELKDIKKNMNIMAIGKYLSDGRDIFHLDEEMVKTLREQTCMPEDIKSLYDVYYYKEDSDGTINIKEMSKKTETVKVIGGEVDQHSTIGNESMVSRYIIGDEE